MPTLISEPDNSPVDKARIREMAKAEGFDAVGFAPADIGETPGDRLQEFIALGRHGDMDWIVEKAAWRRHPQALWSDARTVIVLALNYGPETDPLAHTGKADRGVISVYAQGRDYHDVIKKKLKRIARGLIRDHGGDVKVFVDTAPVMEKPLAAAAGLGWQGKHTNLLSREFGSWLFLGCIFTTLDIPSDAREEGSCGSCTACLDICPTNAFPAPYQLDATRCISYLTIETKSHIERDLRPLIGNRIYGCDDCLAICPWNKYAKQARELSLKPKPALTAPKLAELVTLDDTAFRALFAGTPVKRLGRNRFVRNVLIAIGNGDNCEDLEVVTPLLQDASPIVRVAAVWAVGRLADAESYNRLRDEITEQETDNDVLTEWRLSKGYQNESA
ncbi:tRNA epoxyqueuosine(34) reductase QueG [uncultured Sneathiella sp.]|uniref:tRNA epoxyqueuosine(34) reductase QueG n=1 Tax=uncultured Sneathiella sp. TaxID=879315 RepID=UPI0030DA6A34